MRPDLQVWGHLSPCSEPSESREKRQKRRVGQGDLAAPDLLGDPTKQSHLDRKAGARLPYTLVSGLPLSQLTSAS